MFPVSALLKIPRASTVVAVMLALTAWGTKAAAPPLFLPPVSYDAGGGATVFVAVADVNVDGKADLVVAIQNDPFGAHVTNGLVGILLGRGDGTYAAATTYDSAGMDPFSLAVGDVNGDGKPDIVVANFCVFRDDACSFTTLGLLRGHGDGTFDPAVAMTLGGSSASSVAIDDVNTDGVADVVVALLAAAVGGPAVEVLIGNGDGTFRAPLVAAAGGTEVRAVAVGDLNGDGAPDVVVTGGRSNLAGSSVPTTSVLLGKGDGTFHPVVSYDSGGSPGAITPSVALADVNLDGRVDVAVANYADDRVAVLLGKGDGTLQPAVLYGSGAPLAYSITGADVNGDGRPDLSVATGSDAIGVLLGHGDGTFEPAQVYPVAGVHTSIAAADLNGDGGSDLVVTDGSRSLSVLLNATACDEAPAVVELSADPGSLWPADGRTVAVTVSGRITGSACALEGSAAGYAVRDEYAAVQPSGPVTFGADGRFWFVVQLPAARRGVDLDGRQYTVVVEVRSSSGHLGTATTTVTVPHDRRK